MKVKFVGDGIEKSVTDPADFLTPDDDPIRSLGDLKIGMCYPTRWENVHYDAIVIQTQTGI